MAIAALVVGILALPGLCCYGVGGVVLGVTALILGRVSVRKIRSSNGALGGFGLAQAGWIIGLVAAILGFVILVFYIVVAVLGASGAFNHFSFSSPTTS